MLSRSGSAAVLLCLVTATSQAFAHKAAFKSPADGMHFTQGQPLVIFADIFDERDGKGFIVCPPGESISNTMPPPDYSEPARVAECSGGGTPTGWPQFEVLIDGVLQTDIDLNLSRIPHTVGFNHDGNPDPIGFFRFRAPSDTLAAGPHQIVVRGYFSNDGIAIDTADSDPITVAIDEPPAKTLLNLDADITGPVNWDNVIVVGNGHTVSAEGALVIHESLVTGLGSLTADGLTGTVDSADIAGSIFEDTGAITLDISGDALLTNNEFRANNRLEFESSNPAVPFMISLSGSGTNQKVFQGNRVGAGQMDFGGPNWLIGGDTDEASNVFMGPRTVLNISGSSVTIRGNYSHHNYRGAWSQGFNFYYEHAGDNVLTEHNFIRDSSWPVQYLAGEFRYNVVYGYGHTWIRTTKDNANIHHNIFAPGGDGGLNAGIECYDGETGLSIYNNTFDGGGVDAGDFSNPTIGMSGGAQVASLRNNLVTFSRDPDNGMGTERIAGGAAAYLYADYNAFYSPDNSNKTNYDFTLAGAHDASDDVNGQLASTPFAGERVMPLPNRMIENVIDEAAVWQGTQKVSQVLALFRERYTPLAGSSIIDAGDPQDNDSMGRIADIGAVDFDGHDQDKMGKFGTPPSETEPPTVTLTAPEDGAMVTGSTTVSASAMDNAGGSGIVLVQFLVDGSTVAQATMDPYSASFNSAILTNGEHAFSAKAWDAAGNSAVSNISTVQTLNDRPASVDGGAGVAGGTGVAAGGAASNAGGATSAAGHSSSGATGSGMQNAAANAPSKSGCGCKLSTRDNPQGAVLWLIAAGIVVAAARRRRHCATGKQCGYWIRGR